jgi:hypothetical protein
VNHFNTITNTLIDKLRKAADDKTEIILLNEINRAALDAIALVGFGCFINLGALKKSIFMFLLKRSHSECTPMP